MKKLIFKVFAPGNERRREFVIRTPKGKQFSQQGIERLQSEMASKVEESFPGHDYRFVPIGKTEFNFVHEDACVKCSQPA